MPFAEIAAGRPPRLVQHSCSGSRAIDKLILVSRRASRGRLRRRRGPRGATGALGVPCGRGHRFRQRTPLVGRRQPDQRSGTEPSAVTGHARPAADQYCSPHAPTPLHPAVPPRSAAWRRRRPRPALARGGRRTRCSLRPWPSCPSLPRSTRRRTSYSGLSRTPASPPLASRGHSLFQFSTSPATRA